MNRNYLLIIIGVLLIVASLISFNLNVDNKSHYFGNGIACGIGLSVLFTQISILRKTRRNKND